MWISGCKQCGHIFTSSNKYKVIRDKEGNPYCCDSCKKINEYICYDCHNIFNIEIDGYIEYKNERYCKKCYNKLKN